MRQVADQGISAEKWCAQYTTTDNGPLSNVVIRKDGDNIKISVKTVGFPEDQTLGEAVAECYVNGGLTPRLVAHFSGKKVNCMLIVSLSALYNCEGPGGLITCTLFATFADGRKEYFEQRFSS